MERWRVQQVKDAHREWMEAHTNWSIAVMGRDREIEQHRRKEYDAACTRLFQTLHNHWALLMAELEYKSK